MGFREHFNPASVCLVEWPEKTEGLLPDPDLQIRLVISGEGRMVTISAMSEQGKACLGHF